MEKKDLIPVIILLSGIFLVIFSVMNSEVEIELLFIVPVIYGSGIYLALGILLIFLSFIVGFFLLLGRPSIKRKDQTIKEGIQKDSSYGGVIFIGPIPIIFGKDKSIAKNMMYLGLLIALILAAIYVAVILI
ncbi:MAG: DUF131 domain-containing protein [Candidatus Thermoplasmatota archaeon]